jgi:glycerophosphoryl diester phosphodiesterase
VPGPLLSAHRGGPGAETGRGNTLEVLRAAAELGCEYVELDVQRCRGGVHVVHHDDTVGHGDRRVPIASLTFTELAVAGGSHLLLDRVLEALRGRVRVHLDLKFLSDPHDGGDDGHGHEVALVAHVIDVVGAENVIVTTAEDASVRAVRAWSRNRYPDLPVGLSLGGRGVAGRGPWWVLRVRLEDLFPGRRLRRCDANLVVCQKTLARLRIARWAHRRGLPLLVWTVDSPRELRRWLQDPRVWLVTTNHPRRALAVRRELALRRPPAATARDDDGAPPRSRGGAPSSGVGQEPATKPTRHWSAWAIST